MSNIKSCENCKYFDRYTEEYGQTFTECNHTPSPLNAIFDIEEDNTDFDETIPTYFCCSFYKKKEIINYEIKNARNDIHI